MKVGIIVACHNRNEYLKKCLWSLERVKLPKGYEIFVIDDCSTDNETKSLINSFVKKMACSFDFLDQNVGIKKTLLIGYNYFFDELGFDLVINFDSDAIIHPDCVNELVKNYIPGTLLTGFHSETRSANGAERHIIKSETENMYFKESVGGINFCVDRRAYEDFVKPVLNIEVGNWDYMACVRAGGAYCLKTSLVQHIGFDSTLNHFENPDTAETFKYWDLPTVTLIGVDSNKERLHEAIKKCSEWIRFGAIVELNPDLRSKEEYSNFCINELYKYVHTEHMLICQYDGFVNNWMAWDNDWLKYDYIGAPWHYMDGMEVGNGGFSFRTQRLMQIVAKDPTIFYKHPEDHQICRTYRPYLESQYGIKFAPKEVAEKFSFEGYLQPSKVLSDQFGVHGTNPRRTPSQPIVSRKLIPNQFLSLGDILFLIPMIRELMAEGNSITWPIDEMYLSIRKHFPDIPFVNKADYDLPYEAAGMVHTEHGQMIPYRFANNLRGQGLKDCMRAKYELYGHDYKIWRKLYWKRDYDNEMKLIALLNLPEKFNLINQYYGHKGELKVQVNVENDLPQVHMSNVPGYTLIDWLGVVEKASEIHMANSSLNYLIELMDLKIDVHLYKRDIWGEKLFEYSDYLFENKCFIYHK